MYNSLIFQVITFLQLFVCSFGQSLLQQIHNTQQLISLYQQKLALLLQMAQDQNITIPQLQNLTQNIKKTSKHSTIFKLQQQIIFESDIHLAPNSQYVHPNYVINGTSVMDLNDKNRVFKFVGDVVGFQPMQLTTWANDQEIIIYKLGENFVQNKIKMKLRNQFGRWHHATQFQDIFLQYQQDTLTLTSQKQTKTYRFKSQIIKIFSIHQYKVLFITRYSYGYLNPKSFQITSQTQFDSIVQSCYYSSLEATLLILFNDRNLVVYVHDNVVSKQYIPADIIITKDMDMDYLGGNYLFLHQNGGKCFNIFEIAPPTYMLTHYREICPSEKFRQVKTDYNPFYKYKFFKNRDIYKFTLTDSHSQTKLYIINLKQKQVVSERNFPWKVILIVLSIVGVVYFRSNRSNSKKNQDPQQRIKSTKKLKKASPSPTNIKASPPQNEEEEDQQQYIQSLNNQIKRMRILRQQKKSN